MLLTKTKILYWTFLRHGLDRSRVDVKIVGIQYFFGRCHSKLDPVDPTTEDLDISEFPFRTRQIIIYLVLPTGGRTHHHVELLMER